MTNRARDGYYESMVQGNDHGSGLGVKPTRNSSESELLGKLVFFVTLAAVLAFFWWFLIYDHGVVTVH